MGRLKAGDVIELRREQGLIHVQFLGRDSDLGDAVMVSPNLQNQRPPLANLFDGGYVVFYPVSHVVRRGGGEVIGRLPSRGMPDCYRRPRRFDRSGRITSWLLLTPNGQQVKAGLSKHEKHYPVRAIWNDALLVERVSHGWHPEEDEDAATEDLPDDSASSPKEGTQHYFYFPGAEQARHAVEELVRMGMTAISRPSADESRWLVLATDTAHREHDGLRDRMERLAGLHDGEYDGWEARTVTGEAHATASRRRSE
jgi:hypothetical protein